LEYVKNITTVQRFSLVASISFKWLRTYGNRIWLLACPLASSLMAYCLRLLPDLLADHFDPWCPNRTFSSSKARACFFQVFFKTRCTLRKDKMHQNAMILP
jgi:hypothetical protein